MNRLCISARRPPIAVSIIAALAIVLSGLAVSSCARNAGKTDPNTKGAASSVQDERPAKAFYGPVRRAVAKRYRQAIDGSGKRELSGSSTINFDRSGRFVSEEFYDAKGKRISAVNVVRDKTGRPVGEETRSVSGKLESKAAFAYGPSGLLAEETYYGPDGKATGGYRYEYDGNGRLSKRVMNTDYSDGTSRTNEVTYIYDGAEKLTEEIYAEKSLGLVLRIEHIYREGRRIRSADYQGGSWLEFLTFFTYDQRGNRLRETTFQIPDNEYGDSFQSTTTQDSLPQPLLASETIWEYEYFE